MGTVDNLNFKMKAVLLLSVLASAFAASDTRFLCSECVDEMHMTSGTTLQPTIAQQLKQPNRISVLRSLPDTTSECWMPLSTTTSWMEQCTSARRWVSVMP